MLASAYYIFTYKYIFASPFRFIVAILLLILLIFCLYFRKRRLLQQQQVSGMIVTDTGGHVIQQPSMAYPGALLPPPYNDAMKTAPPSYVSACESCINYFHVLCRGGIGLEQTVFKST